MDPAHRGGGSNNRAVNQTSLRPRTIFQAEFLKLLDSNSNPDAMDHNSSNEPGIHYSQKKK
jgi:hypothetical protein